MVEVVELEVEFVVVLVLFEEVLFAGVVALELVLEFDVVLVEVDVFVEFDVLVGATYWP